MKNKTLTNGELINRYKHKHGIISDYALADTLGVSKQSVNNFRTRETDSMIRRMLTTEMLAVKLPKSKRK